MDLRLMGITRRTFVGFWCSVLLVIQCILIPVHFSVNEYSYCIFTFHVDSRRIGLTMGNHRR